MSSKYNYNLIIKRDVSFTEIDDKYIDIYANETNKYFILKNTWEEYLILLSYISIKELNIEGNLTKKFLSVIPIYGKDFYYLILLIAKKVQNIHVIEDVLDAVIADNLLLVNVIDEIRSLVKSNKVYQGVEKRFEELLKSYSAIQEENTKLNSEVKELRNEVKVLRKYARRLETDVWRPEKRLPVLKGKRELNNYMQTDLIASQRLDLDKNINITIPKELDNGSKKYLMHNFHDILEFIAMRFPILIPYIQYYNKLKGEDLDGKEDDEE